MEEGGFTAASRRLDLATSAISRQVADLETHFGCQLLYRTTRAMHLTAEGRHFVSEFKEITDRLDALSDTVRERQQKVAGELCITSPENSEGLGLRAALSAFMARYPDVRLSWRQLNRYVNLIDEGVDLAIRAGNLADSSLVARKYRELEVLFVASPDFLRRYGTPQHPSDLLRFDCIIELTSNNARRWRYYEEGKEYHVPINGRVEVNEAKLTAAFAAAGQGIAQLPGFMMQPYLEGGALVPVLEGFKVPPIPLSLVYPASKMAKPALRELIDFLLEWKDDGGQYQV